MKRELQILIEELQKEYDYLEREMNSCVKEWDFNGAEAFRKPMIYTRQKLLVLKNLENPNYDRIRTIKAQIERYNNPEIDDKKSKSLVSRRQARISKLENELIQLEKREQIIQNDHNEFINCFERIIKGDLNYFEVFLKEGKLKISIEKSGNSITIFLQTTVSSPIYHYFGGFGLAEIKKIGFEVEEMKAQLEIKEFHESKILHAMEILSRIIFDGLRLYGNKKAEIRC